MREEAGPLYTSFERPTFHSTRAAFDQANNTKVEPVFPPGPGNPKSEEGAARPGRVASCETEAQPTAQHQRSEGTRQVIVSSTKRREHPLVLV